MFVIDNELKSANVARTVRFTEPLFENVTFHKLMGNAYQNSRTIVDVSAEATQVANNGTSAMTAAPRNAVLAEKR